MHTEGSERLASCSWTRRGAGGSAEQDVQLLLFNFCLMNKVAAQDTVDCFGRPQHYGHVLFEAYCDFCRDQTGKMGQYASKQAENDISVLDSGAQD